MSSQQESNGLASSPLVITVAWLWVTVPFAYGVWQLLIKLVNLFSS